MCGNEILSKMKNEVLENETNNTDRNIQLYNTYTAMSTAQTTAHQQQKGCTTRL